jgi:gliding motility-associated-like protein
MKKTIQLFALILFCCSFIYVPAFAQKQGNIWYFGTSAGIDFNPAVPVALNNGAISTNEGCSSISDATTGQLLFYSDGITVWNKNHIAMPNSLTTPLNGNPSSTQSAVIVPKPGSSSLYYIFTTQAVGAFNSNLCYSIVDITLNAGLGDVTNINTVLMDSATEKLCAVGNCGGTEYWIAGHQLNTDSFYAWKLTSSGLSAPVKSKVGIMHASINGLGFNGEGIGYMKFSSNGQKIGLATYSGPNTMELFDFNLNTGQITNPITEVFPTVDPLDGLYGCTFSPDNSKFYVSFIVSDPFSFSNISRIYQYNMLAGSNAAILSSKTLVDSSILFNGALQNGPNGKLYITTIGSTNPGPINVIPNPNNLGTACGFNSSVFTYTTAFAAFGLPAIVENFLSSSNTPLQFNFNSCIGLDSITMAAGYTATSVVSWNFGDPASGAANNSTSYHPTHNFSGPGTYTVSVYVTNGCTANDTATAVVTIGSLGVVLTKDTTICKFNSVQLNASVGTSGVVNYAWLPTAGLSCTTCPNPIFSGTNTSTYTVTATSGNGICTGSKSVTITVQNAPNTQVTQGDSTYCTPATPIQLGVNGGAVYNWSPPVALSCVNCANPVASPNITTTYTVTSATSNGCSKTSTVKLTIKPLNVNIVSTKDSDCTNNLINFTAAIQGSSPTYVWNLGNGTIIANTSPVSTAYSTAGIYTVSLATADNLGCVDTAFKTIKIIGGNYANLQIVDSQLCVGEIANFIDSIGQYSNSFEYNLEPGITLNNIHNPSHLYTNAGIYPVTVTAKNNICPSYIATQNVYVTDFPKVDIGKDTTICLGLSAVINVFNAISSGGSNLWNTGSTSNAIAVGQAGKYFLTVTDKGCSASDTMEVFRDCYINIPNSFSPNGDQINNRFIPMDLLSAGVVSLSMNIFNRWGELVFSTTNINSSGWDGKFGSRPANGGLCIYHFYCFEKWRKKGL